MPATRNESTAKPQLDRLRLLKAVLQGFRIRMDAELLPLGITTAQLRVLWTVAENPRVSGAKIARLCSVTPQTGQALLAKLETLGWVQRHPSAESERVLVAELTASGRQVLLQARKMAERLDARMWKGLDRETLAGLESALTAAAANLDSQSRKAESQRG